MLYLIIPRDKSRSDPFPMKEGPSPPIHTQQIEAIGEIHNLSKFRKQVTVDYPVMADTPTVHFCTRGSRSTVENWAERLSEPED